MGNVFGPSNESESTEVNREALRHGINYVDVVPWFVHGLAKKGMLLETKFNVPKKIQISSVIFCVNQLS